jgi:hypothetical protein
VVEIIYIREGNSLIDPVLITEANIQEAYVHSRLIPILVVMFKKDFDERGARWEIKVPAQRIEVAASVGSPAAPSLFPLLPLFRNEEREAISISHAAR